MVLPPGQGSMVGMDGTLTERARRTAAGAGVQPGSGPSVRGRTATVLAWLRDRDIAVGYAIAVLVVGLYVHTQSGRVADELVLESSTNLVNLRESPLSVLALSAFVVSSLPGLWVLPWLVVAYGAAQRWVGRVGAVVVGLLGHVGATLLVATLLVAGVRHGRLDPSVSRAPDVGVSYGLLAVLGFLSARVPAGRWRLAWVVWLLSGTVGALLYGATFTDVGHLLALLIGFGVAVVAHGAARAAVSQRTPPAAADRARPAAAPPDATAGPPRPTP